MTASTLTRSQRAMQIERRTSRTWTAGVAGINVPSQTVAGKRYSTTLTTCTCGDAYWRGARCKHQLALAIGFGRIPSTRGAA